MRVYQFRHIRACRKSSGAAGSRPTRAPGQRGSSRYHPPVTKDRIQTLLEEAFPDAAELRVIDRGGDDHFEVQVSAPAFNGLSPVAAHKLIYAALEEPWSDGSIHELRINTKGTAS